MKDGTLKALTGLRFVAALWVLLLHLCTFAVVPGVAPDIAARAIGMGWSGVDLFFVLSGYVLSKAYSRDRPEGMLGYWRFLGFRLARIYPMHIVTCLVMLLLFIPVECGVARLSPDPAPYRLPALIAMLTLTQAWVPRAWYPISANPPSWSVSAEFFAYLLFPVLLRGLKRRPALAWAFLVVGAALAPVSQMDLALPVFQYLLPQPLIRIAAGFLIGMATFALQERRTALPFGRWSAAVAGLAIVGWATTVFPPSLSIGDLLFAWLIGALATPGDRAGSALAHPMIVYLGEVSFALYLIQMPVHSALDTLLLWMGQPVPGRLMLSLYVTTSIGAAILLYEVFEKPSRRVLRGQIQRIARARPAVVAPAVA